MPMSSGVTSTTRALCSFANWLALTVFICLFVTQSSGEKSMKCYQCQVESNDLCTDEYLKPCPSDQAYDRCMTIVKYERGKGIVIEKSCALGPCELRDESHSNTLALDENCDRSKDEYTCVGCCRGDGCNKSAAQRLLVSSTLTTLLLALELSRLVSRMTQ